MFCNEFLYSFFSVLQKKITKSEQLARLDRDLRSFNLDDVVTQDPDRALTGVRFFTTTYLGHVRYNYFGIMMLVRSRLLVPGGNHGVVMVPFDFPVASCNSGRGGSTFAR